jgi:hypothetical protein
MINMQLSEMQARARALAQSGTFAGWRSIVFELSFEPGYRNAFTWLHSPSTRDELDDMCRRARERKRPRAA